MTTIYKLTDENMRTYGGYQWKLGEERTAPGNGGLCSSAWLHAYTDPLLAVMLNPIHAYFKTPRLFRGEGTIGATDGGLKIGCTSLTLLEELPLPVVTTEQRVKFAIYCALEVCKESWFVTWAESWLSGKDRSGLAAWAAARTAEAAAATRPAAWAAARTAAWAAARTAEAAAAAAVAVARTAEAAAAWAARAGSLDLISLARRAMSDT